MSFQPLFRRFHEAIQLKQDDHNAELRQKRDKIIKRLRDNLSQSFDWFNQGSYAIGTGIKPLNQDYDIDLGIVFTMDHTKYDPVTVKGWVYEAVKEHTARVEWRRPCITVYYQQAREILYHVDMAILAKQPNSKTFRLAIGKQHAAKEIQEWQRDDRQGFIKAVASKHAGEDAAQFRRVIRYLKRWKDEHFPAQGKTAPTGLALTLVAYHWFRPTKVHPHGPGDYDDFTATSQLVRSMLQRFQQVSDNDRGTQTPRLSLQFPFNPHDDVFARMNNQQMFEFHGRLQRLIGWLDEANTKKSVEPLQKAFGKDFPPK